MDKTHLIPQTRTIILAHSIKNTSYQRRNPSKDLHREQQPLQIPPPKENPQPAMYDGDHGPDANEEAEHQRLRHRPHAGSCRDDLAREPEYCEAESDLRDAEDKVEELDCATAATNGSEGGEEGADGYVARR